MWLNCDSDPGEFKHNCDRNSYRCLYRCATYSHLLVHFYTCDFTYRFTFLPFHIFLRTVTECHHSEFDCASEPRTCIPKAWVCDGEADCENATDEHPSQGCGEAK